MSVSSSVGAVVVSHLLGASQLLVVPHTARPRKGGCPRRRGTCSCDFPGDRRQPVGRRVPLVSGALTETVVAPFLIQKARWRQHEDPRCGARTGDSTRSSDVVPALATAINTPMRWKKVEKGAGRRSTASRERRGRGGRHYRITRRRRPARWRLYRLHPHPFQISR